MSPEQITGAPISIAADLYALGITLFEVVTGRLPFLGPDFVAQHLGEEPPLASTVAEGIPGGWDPILAALLIKNPRERTQTLADLRQELEALDLQGQPRMGPRARRTTGPHSIAALAEEGEVGPRYQFETPLGQTPVSHLARAVDTVLDRSVIIERFDQSDDAAKAVERARMLGRAQSPFVQRALSLDRAARIAVFEAPSGASLADAPPDLPPTETLRVLKRLARGAAAIHVNGGSHGLIAPRTIVLDDVAPTIMVAGLGPVPDSQPLDDVNAIIAVMATLAGCEPTFAAFAKAMCDEVGTTVPPYPAPVDAELLYAAADAVDIAVLSALGSR
jgi:eukaryotic-like serine/threonine-protein kinase